MARRVYQPWKNWGGLAAGVYGHPLVGWAAGIVGHSPPPPATGSDAGGIPVPTGSVRFWPPGHPDSIVMVPMGSQGLSITRAAGWEGIQRPFGLAISAWRGMPAVEATVDVVFERWTDQDSIRPAYDKLTGLMNQGPKAVTGLQQPPPPLMVTIGDARGITIHPQDDATRWVITSIDIDEAATIRDNNGRELRIEAVVGLMQYFGPKSLRDSASTIKKATPKPKRPKPYKAKAGDTLIKIAGSQLHDRSRWHELAKLNPKIRDPRKKIREGTLIKMPA